MDLRKILLISLGHLSCDLNGGALPSLMPYLAAAHGFNYQAAGALMFAYSATSSLVQPVFGYLADKHARSWFVPLAVLLAGGSLGLVGFLDSYWAIFLTLMLCGVGGALFHPEGARYANLVSGNRKGAGMSIFSVGGNSGFVVGPLLVAGATFVAGLHGTAVFLLLALCTASFLFFQMRGWQRQIPQSNAAAGQAEPRNDWHAFGVLTLVIASRSILFLGFNTYIPMYWHDVFGQSKEFGAMMLAFFCVCGVSSNVLGGFLADRIGYARIIRLSWWLALPAALAFAFKAHALGGDDAHRVFLPDDLLAVAGLHQRTDAVAQVERLPGCGESLLCRHVRSVIIAAEPAADCTDALVDPARELLPPLLDALE